MQIPHTSLPANTLRSLIEEFTTREGTDYGQVSTLDQKVSQVMTQLQKGKAHITFDSETETCTLHTSHQLNQNRS